MVQAVVRRVVLSTLMEIIWIFRRMAMRVLHTDMVARADIGLGKMYPYVFGNYGIANAVEYVVQRDKGVSGAEYFNILNMVHIDKHFMASVKLHTGLSIPLPNLDDILEV